MPLHGVDISNWNHPIDPTAVPGDFVICRASEGKGMRDEHFAEYDAKVRPSRKLAGAYHFCWVGDSTGIKNTPQSEAANFAAAIRDHLRPGFLAVCDWEPRHHAGNTDWAVEWALELRRLTGRTPILYANQSTLDRGLWARWRREIGTDYWLAGGTPQYAQRVDGYRPGAKPRNPYGWGDPACWQFTEHGYLPGWAGRLDLNVFYGDAATWRRLADGGAPVSTKPDPSPGAIVIPSIRENDPKVWITTKSKSGWGCVCMQITLPLVETEMKRRGLIKNNIDYFQFGYNKGGVAASAGTHDGAGVVDCAQGITREQRQVWADFGWMMAPRTREWGWNGGPHGHGVLHGCVHRSPAAARQIRDMMAGRNGLVSNLVTNWVKPSRTWQDAARALAPAVTSPKADSKPATPHAIDQEEDPVPELREAHFTIDHDGIDFQASKDHPAIGADVVGPIIYGCEATITGPEGAKLTTRWAVLDRKAGAWTYRSDPVDHATHRAHAAIDNRHTGGDPEVSIFLDVRSDKAGPVKVEQHARFWKKA